MGVRYRVDHRPAADLRTRADLVFAKVRLVVFVDGCFWHGCPSHGTWPKANGDWWRRKIEENMSRDRGVSRQLRKRGWNVIRVWAHEPPELAADRILAAISGMAGLASGKW